jgi:hypothetical protein
MTAIILFIAPRPWISPEMANDGHIESPHIRHPPSSCLTSSFDRRYVVHGHHASF